MQSLLQYDFADRSGSCSDWANMCTVMSRRKKPITRDVQLSWKDALYSAWALALERNQSLADSLSSLALERNQSLSLLTLQSLSLAVFPFNFIFFQCAIEWTSRELLGRFAARAMAYFLFFYKMIYLGHFALSARKLEIQVRTMIPTRRNFDTFLKWFVKKCCSFGWK